MCSLQTQIFLKFVIHLCIYPCHHWYFTPIHHLPPPHLLLLTLISTFHDAEPGLLVESVVIEEHFTYVEAAIFDPWHEYKGEAPLL